MISFFLKTPPKKGQKKCDMCGGFYKPPFFPVLDWKGSKIKGHYQCLKCNNYLS